MVSWSNDNEFTEEILEQWLKESDEIEDEASEEESSDSHYIKFSKTQQKRDIAYLRIYSN